MQAVNLLPEYAQPGRRWAATGSELSSRRILPIGGVAAIAAALLLGGLYFRERSVVSDKKSELANVQARLVAQEARAQPIKAAQASSLERLAMVRSITATRVHWDAVLGDLGRVLPAGVHLSSMSIAGSPAAATSGSSFSVAGETTAHTRVALVLDRLAMLPWLSAVTLQSSSRSGAVVDFTIGATYVAGAGS
jgi:Tfp pilus assembly protein PilN